MPENDLISRSALIAHIGDLGIDPEDDTTFLTTGQACAIAHKCIVEMVKEEPAVDAVEVVRCKDCYKRYDENLCPMCMQSEGELSEYTFDDGYCDRGERRADDD